MTEANAEHQKILLELIENNPGITMPELIDKFPFSFELLIDNLRELKRREKINSEDTNGTTIWFSTQKNIRDTDTLVIQ